MSGPEHNPGAALAAALEDAVDRHGMVAVVEALALVCAGKSDHLAANWQDVPASKRWTAAARAFDRLAGSRAVLGVATW